MDRIKLIILAVVGTLCCACNSDIFVEPIPEIEDNKFTLDGNGGTASFTIPTKGLLGVQIGDEYAYLGGANYYDKDGEYLYNPTLEDVAKMVYATPFLCMEFDIDGDHVTATALDNTTSMVLKISVALNYDHQSQYIDFEITPGRPLEISHLGFDIVNPVSGRYTDRGIPHSFTNNSDRVQHIVIYPYKEAPSRIKLQVEDYDFWARGVRGEIKVPFYTNDEWTDSETNMVDVTLGDITIFYSPDVNIEETYTIEVPAYSKVTTITEVTYATLDVTYIANVEQPGSGMQFWVQGNCQLLQPIAYKITEQ